MTTDIDAMRAAIARDRYQFSEGCAPEDVLDALDELEAARAEIARLRDAIVTIRDRLHADANARDIYISAITKAWETLPNNP